jgi:hypothetical protein
MLLSTSSRHSHVCPDRCAPQGMVRKSGAKVRSNRTARTACFGSQQNHERLHGSQSASDLALRRALHHSGYKEDGRRLAETFEGRRADPHPLSLHRVAGSDQCRRPPLMFDDSNWVNSHGIDFARNSNVFLLAKWIDEGPALSYLTRACPTTGYALCAHLDKLKGLAHDRSRK